MNKKLWIRKLECGHDRATEVAFAMKDYKKPKIGGSCYCRECWAESKIIAIKEAKLNGYV